MKLQNKYRLALVGYRLSGGGSDRVMANLSVYFFKMGIEVHILTVIDEYGYEYKGEVFSTASLKKNRNAFADRYYRFTGIYDFFKNKEFDFIIDFRFRKKNIQQ